MNKPIDVVIPVIKSGSRCNDLELLYSLRSIEKHLKNYGNIVIVGYLPEFINPETVIHIPFKDGPNKQANIRDKILAAFDDSRVSEEVLFMNDDHFILSDFECLNFPYLYYGDLKDTAEKAARYFARNELIEQNLPTKHFDTHFPIVYKKSLFIEAMKNFSDNSSIKSKYCNFWNIEGVEFTDLKINSSLHYERILQEIKDRPAFSIGDYGLNQPMKRVLSELFPNPSKFELIQQNKAA